jgi:hypothetical protein
MPVVWQSRNIIFFGETSELRGIQIEHAELEGKHELGSGSTIAHDMPGKLLHVRHDQGAFLLEGGAAHAPPHADLRAGRAPAEGAEPKLLPIK